MHLKTGHFFPNETCALYCITKIKLGDTVPLILATRNIKLIQEYIYVYTKSINTGKTLDTLKLDGDGGKLWKTQRRIFCCNSFLPGDGLGFSDLDRAQKHFIK